MVQGVGKDMIEGGERPFKPGPRGSGTVKSGKSASAKGKAKGKAKEKDADCKTEMAALADCLKGDKPADQCSELKTRLDSCRSKTPGKAKA